MRRLAFSLTIAVGLALPMAVRGAEPPPAGGLRAYVDPATGADVASPAPATDEAARAKGALVPSPDAPLPSAVPNAGPGGGGMIDVRGRLQSDVTATLDPDGEVRVRCTRPGEPGTP